MHSKDSTNTRQRLSILAAAAITVTLILLVVGVRQATTHLYGNSAASAQSAEQGATAPSGQRNGAASSATSPGESEESSADGQPPPGGGEPARGTMAAGPVVADEQYVFTRQADQVTVGMDSAGILRLPDRAPPADGGGIPGQAETPGDVTDEQAVEVSDEPTFGVRVETTGHLATVHAATGPGLVEDLSSLEIDFGDGTSRQLTEREIARLRSAGAISIVHTYAPTLTPQPQVVTATAIADSGQTYQRSVEFETRAAFRLTYSPLTVTALNDCDTFGKGDFELTWRLDSRPERRSEFDLGKGESYVERRFRIGVSPVYYDEPLEYFEVSITEKDPPGAYFVAFWRWSVDFHGSSGSGPGAGGPVAQLGNHRYDVWLEPFAGSGDDCRVRMDFTIYLTMIDSLDHR